MKDAEAAHGTGSAADDALESQPILDGTQPGSSSGGGGGREDDSLQPPLSPRSRWRAWKADPLVRAAAVNLGLILTWCGREPRPLRLLCCWRPAGGHPTRRADRPSRRQPCLLLLLLPLLL